MSTVRKDSRASWLICFGAFIAYLLETGMLKCLGVLLPAIREEFETQTWVIGLIISLMPGYGIISCILGGALAKHYSSRSVMMVFGLLTSIGLVMASFSQSVVFLAISILLTGFTMGAEAITISVLPDYFDEYFDESNGIVHAGLSIGLMVLPVLTQFLHHIYGWRGALLILGGINLHILSCAALFKPVATTSQNQTDYGDSESAGFVPGSLILTSIVRNLDLKLFTNFKYVSIVSLLFGQGYYFVGWLLYFVPHTVDNGFSPYEATAMAAVGGIGNLLGNISFSLLAKVISKKKLLYIGFIMVALSLMLDPILTLSRSYIGLMLASAIFNFGYSINSCGFVVAVSEVVDEKQFLSAVNWMYAAYSVGAILSGYFTGWLFDYFGNYTASFLCLGGVPIVSLCPLLISDIHAYVQERRYTLIPTKDPAKN